jgi:hypothetical protein
MTKITVVTYCHEAHQSWIPSWLEQIQRQVFTDFKIIFIFHNWNDVDKLKDANNLISSTLGDRVCTYDYDSPPVIGNVIDEGCRRVDTEFFAHWDVDDIIHPERLRLQSEFLDAHPETDFLGTRMVGFTGEPRSEMLQLDYVQPDEPNLEVTDHDDIYRVLLRQNQNCLGHTTMIYRPGVLQDLGGFSRSDVKLDGKSPDFETWKKALMAGYRFHRLPQLCALWRLDSSSIRS